MKSFSTSNQNFQRYPYVKHLRRRPIVDSNNGRSVRFSNSSDATTLNLTWKKSFVLYFRTFCDKTTFHGFNYFAEPNRPIFERIFGVIVLVLAFTSMLMTIKPLIFTYMRGPTLMTVSGKVLPIWDIPFPAITFCSDNRVPSFLVNISDLLMTSKRRNLSTSEVSLLYYAADFCSDTNSEPFLKNITSYEDKYHSSSSNLESFGFMAYNQMCERSVRSLLIKLKTIDYPCSYMQVSSVESNLCLTFNMMPPLSLWTKNYISEYLSSQEEFIKLLYPYKFLRQNSSWFPDTGFSNNNASKRNILRFHESSLENTVRFLLDFCKDEVQKECIPRSDGFMVIVHNPAEIPTTLHVKTYARVNERVVLQVIPKFVKTDDRLREWKPKDRGCYYNHERPLSFFGVYTSHNCDAECEANITLQHCGCNLISQPHFSNVRVCESEDQECVIQSLLKSTNDINDDDSLFGACDCLPPCNELTYDIDVTVQPRNWTYNTEMYEIPRNETKMDSYVNVAAIYRYRQVNCIVRVGRMILSDLVADLGGLMSLFLGFSFISICEIIYFSTVRLFTEVQKKKECEINVADTRNIKTKRKARY